MKHFNLRRIFLLMSAAGAVSISNNAMASAFMLWEQDAASIGNYHAGTAAIADDASTAWYNPAGMVRIKNQQLILGADPVVTNFRFRGTVGVDKLTDLFGNPVPPTPTTGQGGTFNVVPFGHYVAPINDRFAVGMSVDIPFGLKTDYGNDPYISYAASLTSLRVIDFTPSVAVKVTDQFSVGAGFDAQKLDAEFDQLTTAGIPGILVLDTNSKNKSWDWGYGWRAGVLFQPTQQTRIGLNYHSKVTHHTKGRSYFTGPLAENGSQFTDQFFATATLPATTSLSIFQALSNCWDVMGSVSYTQWSVFKDLVLQNVAGIDANTNPSNNVIVTVNEHYRNSWNVALGANYHASEKWTIRTGLGWDQSPTNNNYRNLQLPDSDRIAVALGAHWQAFKQVGFDAGYTHIFAMNTRINNVSQTFGPETDTTNGSVRGSADVYGIQVKWDMV